MVPTEEYYPDRAYLFAFLLSARLFIKPHELLGEVCALCEHQQNLNGEGGKVRRLSLHCSTIENKEKKLYQFIWLMSSDVINQGHHYSYTCTITLSTFLFPPFFFLLPSSVKS